MTAVTPYASGISGRTHSVRISTMIDRDAVRRQNLGTLDRDALFALHDTWRLHAHAVRSNRGYSGRALAAEAAELILGFGFFTVDCDIALEEPTVSPGSSGIDIPGTYVLRRFIDTCPASESSWVAEAAWKSIPAEGSFTIHLPARKDGRGKWVFADLQEPPRGREGKEGKGSSQKWFNVRDAFSKSRIDDRAIDAAANVLTRGIALALKELLKMEGVARLAKRGAVYGNKKCPLEACAREDGIDSVMVLNAALAMKDGNEWPPVFQDASAGSKDRAAALAARICGMVKPKEWWSTERERLDARPLLVSRSVVLLELSKPTAPRSRGKQLTWGARVLVGRNAFAEKSEILLGWLEETMEEFVALLNAMVLESSNLAPEDVHLAWDKMKAMLANDLADENR